MITSDMSEKTAYQLELQDGIGKIYLPNSFTVVEAVPFKDDIQTICREHPELSLLILDFSETTFMDSSGLGALVVSRRVSGQHNIELVLQNVSPQVMLVLSMTDLDKVFAIKQQSQPAETKTQTVENKPFSTHPSVRSRTKRLIDIVGSLAGLIITGILFIPLAIAIKVDDPGGPIFFGQTRCSWMGRRFKIWKFRSMVSNAEALKHTVKNEAEGAIFKNASDPRITRVGRFIRKTSLDEFPQFWNVLKGEMSLVGTRPPTPDELEAYEVPQWQRLDVKPGITGEWQVNGRSSVTSFEDIIRLDLRYQDNWSLMYDLQLILKTVLVVFSKDSGAV